MNTSGSKVFAFGIWVVIVTSLLLLKNERDRAYWKAVTDEIISKNQPPHGEVVPVDDISTAGEVPGEGADAEVVDGQPPRGMAGIAVPVGGASEDALKALGRNERVLP